MSRDAVLLHFPLNLPSDDPFFGAMLALQDRHSQSTAWFRTRPRAARAAASLMNTTRM